MCVLKYSIFGMVFLAAMMLRFSSCNDMLDLTCNSNEDCASYEDKMVSSACNQSRCQCSMKRGSQIVDCTPKQISVSNKIGDCPSGVCNVPHSHCNITTNKCVCDKGFIESNDLKRCIAEVVHLGNPCELTSQCTSFDSNSVCINGTCNCLANFTQSKSSNMMNESSWDSHTMGVIKCLSLVKIGENCSSSEECTNFTANALCFGHKCACDENFTTSEDGNQCLHRSFYNDTCLQDRQCLMGVGPGSFCKNGTCLCGPKHVFINDNGKVICKREVLYGDKCDSHNECQAYLGKPTMHCVDNKCKCREDHELYDAYSKTCTRKVNPQNGASRNGNLIVAVIGLLLIALLGF